MSIIGIVIILIVIGVLLYCVHMLPLDARIARIIDVVVIVATLIWLLSLFFPGTLNGFGAGCNRPIVVHTR